ncbi:MAG TPA: hypothetical protein VFH74_00325 [Gaiellales bacterium]|nr:hypothetical protein [Gaiellales bacterium]
MTLQNRVTPFGALIADPARGLVYGNRGCLHDASGRLRRRHATRRWIACRLEFRGWHRGPLMQPGRFTELFFLDDATALAAGHRPCALCRRTDYTALTDMWARLHDERPTADSIDTRLHGERLAGPARRLHVVDGGRLPDGACVVLEGDAWMVIAGVLRRWTPAGYGEAASIRTGPHHVLTPPSLLELLRSSWRSDLPLLHPSAGVAPYTP